MRALCLTLALLTTGCTAFLVDRGELVTPTRSLERPGTLPAAQGYVDAASRWRREARVGVAGAISATLRDPGLVAYEVAHAAAVQGMDAAASQDLFAREWLSAFGAEHDRFPIDLEWRFDEQFVAHAEILEPRTWRFVLHVDEHFDYQPLAVATLEHSQTPIQHFWEGRIRLWFPWRDHGRNVSLLGGDTRAVRLELRHPVGTADVTWRFRTAY